MARRSNIVEEPCTLVYSLLENAPINFDQFSLIVRSLHTYMVEDIKPLPDQKCVHVMLKYQASVKNATNKLGALEEHILISKMSTYVKQNELFDLDTLQKQYGFGSTTTSNEQEERPTTSYKSKSQKPRYKAVPYARPENRE